MREKKLSITKVRDNFNKIARDIAKNKNSVVVQSSEEDLIAMIPLSEYSILKEARAVYETNQSKSEKNLIENTFPTDGIFKYYQKMKLPPGVKVEDIEDMAKGLKAQENYSSIE